LAPSFAFSNRLDKHWNVTAGRYGGGEPGQFGFELAKFNACFLTVVVGRSQPRGRFAMASRASSLLNGCAGRVSLS
jgi:hypothetical protein